MVLFRDCEMGTIGCSYGWNYCVIERVTLLLVTCVRSHSLVNVVVVEPRALFPRQDFQ